MPLQTWHKAFLDYHFNMENPYGGSVTCNTLASAENSSFV